MRILFDEGTPRQLRACLRPHMVVTLDAASWKGLKNGALLDQAERHDFDILITVEKNLQFHQNLKKRRIAIIVLDHGKWPDVKVSVPRILDAINAAKPGTYTIVECFVSFGTSITEESGE